MRERIPILAVVAVLVLASSAGTAVAHPNAGASANCGDGDDASGDDLVRVDPDQPEPEPVEAVVAAEEVVTFGAAKATDPSSENVCDGEEDDDYVEAHVAGGDTGVQVCYSDANDRDPGANNVDRTHAHNGYCEGSEGGNGLPSTPDAPSPPDDLPAPSPPDGVPPSAGDLPSPPDEIPGL